MSYEKYNEIFKSEIEAGCTLDNKNTAGRGLFHEDDNGLNAITIGSLKKYENRSNVSSSLSPPQYITNGSEINDCQHTKNEVRLRESNKNEEILSKLKNFSCKNDVDAATSVSLINSQYFNTPEGIDNIPFESNCLSSDHEQLNIVECLLDLDDYLKKMDEEDNTDLNSERQNSTLAKNRPSSIRVRNSPNSITPFERCSKLRKTIACTMHAQKDAAEHEVSFLQGTWNNESVKKHNHQHETDSNINFDLNGGTCSANVAKLGSPQELNPARFELTKTYVQVLTDEQIFQNLIEQQLNVETDRPRQYGRRSERFSTFSSQLNESTSNFNCVSNENVSPINVVVSASLPEVPCHNGTLYEGSDESTPRGSRNTTPVSTESTSDSVESLSISETLNGESNAASQENYQQTTQSIDTEIMNPSSKNGFNSYWPHDHSRTLALISCTLGLFNTSRFATLTINYGGNFLIQFFILSIIFGIPFFWLQMSLGAKIEAGPVSMWRISPICIGVGISITLVQYIITIYSTVTLAWLLKFIQDIFIHKSEYVWSEYIHFIGNRQSSDTYSNITESIPYYFNVNILQRAKILKINDGTESGFHISDRQIAFYLVFVWAAVFIILCKGLKSFGKWILLLGVLPIFLLGAVLIKLLCIVDFAKLQNILSSSEFDDFLVNSKTWAAAAQETFLTWGLFGASVIAISSRTHRIPSKLTLRKDAILVALVTLIGLCISALVGLCTIQILNELNYVYVPGSYETPEHFSSIFSLKALNSGSLISYPTKYVPHYSTLVGEVYKRHPDTSNVSGYQVLRFITELLPAAVTVSNDNMSWIWTLILFIAFFVFGLSQLCVMWKPISCALGNSSSTILLSCFVGLLLSIPFATELGITLIHYMDILLGGAWFIPILWSAEIFGIFLVRGRPYNGDDLVNDLKMSGSMSAFLALSWNILLPIGLITLAIIEYKISQSNQFYYWRVKSCFNYWSRKAGALTQIGILLLVPIAAIIQICRYLTSGPPDILHRIQMLYRPLDEGESMETSLSTNRNIRSSNRINNQRSAAERFQNDDPPKYTPPPSYTTATGAKLSKILRQSFRRSVRRLLREPESLRPELSIPHSSHSRQTTLPAAEETRVDVRETIEFESSPSVNFIYGRSLSLGRKQILNKYCTKETTSHLPTERFNNVDSSFNRRSSYKLHNRPFTAEDVKTILRSSTFGRKRTLRSPNLQTERSFRSIENLVQNAEPPSITAEIVNEHDRSDENLTSDI